MPPPPGQWWGERRFKMEFPYKNNGQVIITDVRVYTGDKYGDSPYLCTERSLYLDLKDVWSGDEKVTLENLDFEGQTTDLPDYLNDATDDMVDDLLRPEMTGTSPLWANVRTWIKKNRNK
jgi:hypothetical protein